MQIMLRFVTDFTRNDPKPYFSLTHNTHQL